MSSCLLRLAMPLLLALPLVAPASASTDCLSEPAPQTLPVRDGLVAAPASGFVTQPASLFPAAHDESLALDRVLQRQRLEGCLAAMLAPASVGAGSAVAVSADGYVPRTEFDNAPHRFNMEQGGKRMTAEDFDAWMAARGYRVAKGKPAQASEVVGE
jgi:hypothetical protein